MAIVLIPRSIVPQSNSIMSKDSLCDLSKPSSLFTPVHADPEVARSLVKQSRP